MGRKSLRDSLTNYQQGVRWLDKCIAPSWRYIFDILDGQWQRIGLAYPEPCVDAKLMQSISAERGRLTQWAIEQTLKKSMPDLKENTVLIDDDEVNPVVAALEAMQGKVNDKTASITENTAAPIT